MDSDRIGQLKDEFLGIKGMVAEVRCKSRLLKQQIETGTDGDVERKLEQMTADLAKYCQRMDEIAQECYALLQLE